MSKYDKLTVIIPAYNPDEALVGVLEKLLDSGFNNIIVVNDGSKAECDMTFQQVASILEKCNGVLLKHSVNLGQGRAYKTAFNYYLEHFSDTIGVIQCDADGQHHINDICKCAEMLLKYPKEFILGERDFDARGIPFRSRFGNKCTSYVFKFLCGINIKDTQTGLKGIPRDVIRFLIETPGERFEYATSVLLELKKRNVKIKPIKIETIYIDENASSHFNPVMDSIRIYSTILKYLASSLMTVAIDLFVFGVMVSILKSFMGNIYYVFFSSATAKVFSGIFNFVFNKKIVFYSDGSLLRELLKYTALCVLHIVCSSALVVLLTQMIIMPEVVAKMFVDVLLFFVIYYIQRVWVFRKG